MAVASCQLALIELYRSYDYRWHCSLQRTEPHPCFVRSADLITGNDSMPCRILWALVLVLVRATPLATSVRVYTYMLSSFSSPLVRSASTVTTMRSIRRTCMPKNGHFAFIPFRHSFGQAVVGAARAHGLAISHSTSNHGCTIAHTHIQATTDTPHGWWTRIQRHTCTLDAQFNTFFRSHRFFFSFNFAFILMAMLCSHVIGRILRCDALPCTYIFDDKRRHRAASNWCERERPRREAHSNCVGKKVNTKQKERTKK